ncbi:MAG: hypothetical protein BAJALOKI1v1_1160009 [Promethearchaeota archaeon]|nr:MAG: hypothetical protein BAJALOKI1v1_1160009 [Candidatus Lokiarchaeota archaeon]
MNENSLRCLEEINKNKICLIGGLGLVGLYVDILDSLEHVYGIIPQKYHLITSPEKHRDFQDQDLDLDFVNNTIHEYDYQTVLRENYTAIYEICTELIEEERNHFDIVCELTGGTKPVSIALTILSQKYNLPRIYYSGERIIEI